MRSATIAETTMGTIAHRQNSANVRAATRVPRPPKRTREIFISSLRQARRSRRLVPRSRRPGWPSRSAAAATAVLAKAVKVEFAVERMKVVILADHSVDAGYRRVEAQELVVPAPGILEKVRVQPSSVRFSGTSNRVVRYLSMTMAIASAHAPPRRSSAAR